MELKDILEKRQSIRKYKSGDVPDEHIEEIIKAAGMAPSGKNSQNWHFVTIKNQKIKEELGDIIEKKNHMIGEKLKEKDPERGANFQKFAKHFTLFSTKIPVLTVVYAKDYYPTGYYELEMLGAPNEVLEDLLHLKNPGMQNIGAALENFTLKAIDLGYATCWLTSANYVTDEIEAYLKDKIGFAKEGYRMVAMMSLGVPEENQKSPKKKELEEYFTLIK